jgi:hypothetical protein
MSQEDIESEEVAEVIELERCSACYDELTEDNKVILECPHALCKWCYEPCITEAARCPVCRHTIKIIPKNDSLNTIEWTPPILPRLMEPEHMQITHDLRIFGEDYQIYVKEHNLFETRLRHAMELNKNGYDVTKTNFVAPQAPTINRVIYLGQDTYSGTYILDMKRIDENTIYHIPSDKMIHPLNNEKIGQNSTMHHVKNENDNNKYIKIIVSKVLMTGDIVKLTEIRASRNSEMFQIVCDKYIVRYCKEDYHRIEIYSIKTGKLLHIQVVDKLTKIYTHEVIGSILYILFNTETKDTYDRYMFLMPSL